MRMRIALAITWLVTLAIMMVNLWEVQKPCHQHSVASIPNDPESMFYHPNDLNINQQPNTDCACETEKLDLNITAPAADTPEYKVPNIVHFIWYSFSTKPLEFHQMLSILSASKIIKPDIIYFHTNLQPVGKYWLRVKQLPGLRINYRKPPEKLFGERLKEPVFYTSHSNVDRLTLLSEYGGIYLDLDVLVTKPFDELRKHECTIGLEGVEMACNSVIVCAKNSPFLLLWINSFLDDYQVDEWSYNSGKVPYKLSKRFPQLVNIEEDKLNRPNSRELTKIWGKEKFNWRENFAVHLWFRIWKTMSPLYPGEDPGESNILEMDSTFGEISRAILYGDPGIVDHKAVTLNTVLSKQVTPTPSPDGAAVPLNLRGAARAPVRPADHVMRRGDDVDDEVYEYEQPDDEEEYDNDVIYALPHRRHKTVLRGNIRAEENAPEAVDQKETDHAVANEYERKQNAMVDEFDTPLDVNQGIERSEEEVKPVGDSSLVARQKILQELISRQETRMPPVGETGVNSQMVGQQLYKPDKPDDVDNEGDLDDYDDDDDYDNDEDLSVKDWVDPRHDGNAGDIGPGEHSQLHDNLDPERKVPLEQHGFDAPAKNADFRDQVIDLVGDVRDEARLNVFTERPLSLSNVAVPRPPFQRPIQPGILTDPFKQDPEINNLNQPLVHAPVVERPVAPGEDAKETPNKQGSFVAPDQGMFQDDRRIHLGQFSHPEMYALRDKQQIQEAPGINAEVVNQPRIEQPAKPTPYAPEENIVRDHLLTLDKLHQALPPPQQPHSLQPYNLLSKLRAPLNPNSILNPLPGQGGSPGGLPDLNRPLVDSLGEQVVPPRPGEAPLPAHHPDDIPAREDSIQPPPPVEDRLNAEFNSKLMQQRNPLLGKFPLKAPYQRFLNTNE